MCGIVGIVAKNASVNPDLLELATKSLAHRGPDDSGTVMIRDTVPESLEVGLGHRRLAILDLSPLGRQPMQDPETGNWITYNGEIYNFREIREELEGEGASFRSQSDTEVLLRAYGRWGEGCLPKLRGMFAFAIWDAKRHQLFLARDPMGIKPLYYFSSDRHFLFASEIRTLLGTGLVPRRVDRAGLLNYLAFGSAYDPVTLVEGVSALPPGHSLVWESGTLRQKMYWDMGEGKEQAGGPYVPPGKAGRQHVEDELHAALAQSIQMHMVSDVPVGVFLSGGIDSSTVTGILSRNGARLNTFSIVFREADYSEAEYSRLVARTFHTEHHELLVSQRDALATIPSALGAMDQPTVDGLNTYFVARQTRAAGIKVVLSGLGGDELFAGYSSFRTVPRMERFLRISRRIPKAVQRRFSNAFGFFMSDTDQSRKLAALASANGNLLHPYFLSRMLFTPQHGAALLPLIDSRELDRSRAPLAEHVSRAMRLDPINRVSYLESRCYMLNTLLRDTDVMSMAHGLEVRVPLIDHRLAEKLIAVPGRWKIDRQTPKPLLVGALRGALPDSVVHRPKRGFTLPFEHWLRDELRVEVETTLRKIASSPLSGILNVAAVESVWKDFQQRRTSWSRPWSLYVLQRWCDLHSITA
jgi:asparagine synthase (glutamine-hydrolysing)